MKGCRKMASVITKVVEDPILRNTYNRIIISVQLEKYWENIVKKSYLLMEVSITVPIIADTPETTIVVELQEEFQVFQISHNKMVEMVLPVKQAIDLTRTIDAEASFICYNKIHP